MQKEERKSDLSNGSVFSRIITKKRNKQLSSIQEKTEEIRQLMEEVAKCYNMKAILDVPTERDLIYYLYLNPVGSIDSSNKKIMQSPIADQYFRMGILTNGVGDGLSSQYRLTAYGRNQIKNALDLEMLG